MASESSFDIVSEFDRQELVNALDQVKREILNRYDFKGSKTTIELEKDKIVIITEHDMRLQAISTSLLAISCTPSIFSAPKTQPFIIDLSLPLITWALPMR